MNVSDIDLYISFCFNVQCKGCELIMEAIKKAGYEGKCTIGLDVAASEFKVKGKNEYDLDFKYDGNKISGEALGELYESLAADYPIVTIEDPFDEDDWENWAKFTKANASAPTFCKSS